MTEAGAVDTSAHSRGGPRSLRRRVAAADLEVEVRRDGSRPANAGSGDLITITSTRERMLAHDVVDVRVRTG